MRSEDTGGVIAILEETVPAKRLITPHVHENDVWLYVLRGEIGALIGDDIVVATPGTWVLKPRGILHAMWNPESEIRVALQRCFRNRVTG